MGILGPPAPRVRSRLGGLLRRLAGGFAGARFVALVLLLALLALRVADPPPLQLLRLKVFDFYQQLQPRTATPLPVAIVDLDEESLGEFGQWPWPRALVADLVDGIAQAGAAAMAFDVVFAEADRMSPRNVARWLEGKAPELAQRVAELDSDDDALAAAMKRTRVVLGQAGYPRRLDTERAPQPTVPIAMVGPSPETHLFSSPGLVRNLAELEEAASGIGMFSIKPERDGLIRRLPLMLRAADGIRPTLSLELLRVATGQSTYAIKSNAAGIDAVVIAGQSVPTDANGRMWVRFTGHDRNRYVSARDVLQGAPEAAKLRGKLVLIGTSATGLLDIKTTPLSASIPGVEVHAQALETILQGEHMVRPNFALGAEITAAAAIGLLVIVLVPVLGALWTLAIGTVAMAGVLGGTWLLYSEELLLLDPSYAAAASFMVYALLTYMNYVREEGMRRQVRSAFSQYLSPDLVERLAQQPGMLKLGGETREMTILFSDVRGFTTVSETFKDDPQGLTRLLNRILTPLSARVLERHGTIDKYIGDALMAFWNAPLDDGAHARNACASALAMREALEAVNAERQAECRESGAPYVPIAIGIGINTGSCVVGNMGSEQRFDYSVMGDAVNLASRLEGQSRVYGTDIVIGETTVKQADDAFALVELDLVRVKGKQVPERIYGLLGDAAMRETPAFRQVQHTVVGLHAAYRATRWPDARAACGELRESGAPFGLTRLAEVFEARIAAFEAEPPAHDWDGVFDAHSK